ncbi:hypothetical protein [Oceanobacillus alkalisoli]|uniref:hypothetical protein n=1 Tax=Oceanobacillus alkalisoli TaxID=2925113 RepID=UPI001EE45B8C|nr:hypothetical protein [Oceanobacillus alkalisoli]MCG5104427.1 hypothetical protein [Oceanobacillus alkalisoli]
MSELEKIKEIFLEQVYNMNQIVTFDREHAEWLINRVEILEKDNDWLNRSLLDSEKAYQELRKSFKEQTDRAVKGWEKVIELEKENQRINKVKEICERDNERLTERVRQLETLLNDTKATLFNEIIEQEKILGSTPIEDEKLISHRKGIVGGLRISLSFLN